MQVLRYPLLALRLATLLLSLGAGAANASIDNSLVVEFWELCLAEKGHPAYAEAKAKRQGYRIGSTIGLFPEELFSGNEALEKSLGDSVVTLETFVRSTEQEFSTVCRTTAFGDLDLSFAARAFVSELVGVIDQKNDGRASMISGDTSTWILRDDHYSAISLTTHQSDGVFLVSLAFINQHLKN